MLDVEFSFWTLELDMKLPIPKVTDMPYVDFMLSQLANAASMDTLTLGGMSHPSRSGTSLVDEPVQLLVVLCGGCLNPLACLDPLA